MYWSVKHSDIFLRPWCMILFLGLDTPVQIGVNLDGNNGGMLTFHMPF